MNDCWLLGLISNHLLVRLRNLHLLDFLLHDGVDDGVPERYCSLNSQEVVKRVAVTELNLELLPNVPEGRLVLAWIAELAQVGVNASSPFNLIQLAL